MVLSEATGEDNFGREVTVVGAEDMADKLGEEDSSWMPSSMECIGLKLLDDIESFQYKPNLFMPTDVSCDDDNDRFSSGKNYKKKQNKTKKKHMLYKYIY